MNPAYFSYRTSSRLELPLVVSVPHAGLRVPESRKELMMLPETVFRRDVDFQIHQMWEEASAELDLSYVKSEIHRYAIDLNRSSTQDTLIWKESTRQEPLGPSGARATPSAEVVASLVDEIWQPYYDFIVRELERVKSKFGFAILIDGHSMPSRGTAFHADPGSVRAEIVPGDDHGKACHKKVLEAALESAQGLGFSVTPNKPYSGGNITRHFGNPAQGIHALQIEVNRAIYIRDEESEEKIIIPEGMNRLKSLARTALHRLGQIPKDSLRPV